MHRTPRWTRLYFSVSCILFYFAQHIVVLTASAVITDINHLATAAMHDYFLEAKTTCTIANDRTQYFRNKLGDEVKVYRPEMFEMSRRLCGISEESFVTALNPLSIRLVQADSKSGQTFWKSGHEDVVFKTIRAYECRNFRNILCSYISHISDMNSCLSGILGVYRIRIGGGAKIYVLACKNVFTLPTVPNIPLSKFGSVTYFDLKGSTYGRSKSQTSVVLKDNDLIARVARRKPPHRLMLNGDNLQQLIHTLRRDVAFLKKHRLMDYSAIITEIDVTTHDTMKIGQPSIIDKMCAYVSKLRNYYMFLRPSMRNSARGSLMLQGDSGFYYSVGIIDFLQKYSGRKYLETLFKSMYVNGDKISCVDPDRYADRLIDFITSMAS